MDDSEAEIQRGSFFLAQTEAYDNFDTEPDIPVSNQDLRKFLRSERFLLYDVVYVLLLVVLSIVFSQFPIWEHRQMFDINDVSIQFPIKESTVGTLLLGIITKLVLPVILIIYNLVIMPYSPLDIHYRRKVSSYVRYAETVYSVLGFFACVATNLLCTALLKNFAGRPRPDFIARCIPISDLVGLQDYTVCTQTDKALMRDGFKSWPSGHTSAAFSSFLYLGLYIYGKAFTKRGHRYIIHMWALVLCLLCASYIGISRVIDNRHRPSDVISGAILGSLIAYATYTTYYHSPFSTDHRKTMYSKPFNYFRKHIQMKIDNSADV